MNYPRITINLFTHHELTRIFTAAGYLFMAIRGLFMAIAFSPCGRRTSFRVPFFLLNMNYRELPVNYHEFVDAHEFADAVRGNTICG